MKKWAYLLILIGIFINLGCEDKKQTNPGSPSPSPTKKAWGLSEPVFRFENQPERRFTQLSPQESRSLRSSDRLYFNDLVDRPNEVRGVQLQVTSHCTGQSGQLHRQKWIRPLTQNLPLLDLVPHAIVFHNDFGPNQPLTCDLDFMATHPLGHIHTFKIQGIQISIDPHAHNMKVTDKGDTVLPLAEKPTTIYENNWSHYVIYLPNKEISQVQWRCDNFYVSTSTDSPGTTLTMNQFNLSQAQSLNKKFIVPYRQLPHQTCRLFAFHQDQLLAFSHRFWFSARLPKLQIEVEWETNASSSIVYFQNPLTYRRRFQDDDNILQPLPLGQIRIYNPHPFAISLTLPKIIPNSVFVTIVSSYNQATSQGYFPLLFIQNDIDFVELGRKALVGTPLPPNQSLELNQTIEPQQLWELSLVTPVSNLCISQPHPNEDYDRRRFFSGMAHRYDLSFGFTLDKAFGALLLFHPNSQLKIIQHATSTEVSPQDDIHEISLAKEAPQWLPHVRNGLKVNDSQRSVTPTDIARKLYVDGSCLEKYLPQDFR